MRNHLSLITLVGILAILSVYWTHVRAVAKPEDPSARQGPEVRPLLKFNPTTVLNLQIHRGRNPVISVKRQAGKEWLVVSPFLAQADTYLVDRALAVLGLITVQHTMAQEEGEPLSQFGLNQNDSLITITMITKDTQHWLELGGVSANGLMQYARSSDSQEIVLIERKSVQAFPQAVDEFIDRRLFPLAQETLHTIELKDARGSVVLQAGNKGWLLESPVHARADHQVMTEWLQRLAGLNASAVHPSDPQGGSGSQSFSPWVGSLRMAAGEVSATADIFRTPERIVIYRSDQPSLRYETSTEMLSAILQNPFALQDKRVLQEEAGTIAMMEFRQQGHSVRLLRAKAGWARNGQLLGRDHSEAMEHWLAELHLSEGGALLRALNQCKMTPSLRWELRVRDHKSQPLGRTAFARTQACGDLATLPSGEWVRLQNTTPIDFIQRLGMGQAPPVPG